MKSVIDFFKGLFDTHLWPARWYCGYWSDFHGWLYIISDMMIWIAYFLIPVIIFNYVSKRKQVIKYPGIYLLFGAFILLCGSTHFLEACMFWVPMYRLNGIGIEEKEFSRIFEAFTRLNAHSEFEGSGIGLTICRKIVSIHKGNIGVNSIPGEGTTFTIDLPALT